MWACQLLTWVPRVQATVLMPACCLATSLTYKAIFPAHKLIPFTRTRSVIEIKELIFDFTKYAALRNFTLGLARWFSRISACNTSQVTSVGFVDPTMGEMSSCLHSSTCGIYSHSYSHTLSLTHTPYTMLSFMILLKTNFLEIYDSV